MKSLNSNKNNWYNTHLTISDSQFYDLSLTFQNGLLKQSSEYRNFYRNLLDLKKNLSTRLYIYPSLVFRKNMQVYVKEIIYSHLYIGKSLNPNFSIETIMKIFVHYQNIQYFDFLKHELRLKLNQLNIKADVEEVFKAMLFYHNDLYFEGSNYTRPVINENNIYLITDRYYIYNLMFTTFEKNKSQDHLKTFLNLLALPISLSPIFILWNMERFFDNINISLVFCAWAMMILYNIISYTIVTKKNPKFVKNDKNIYLHWIFYLLNSSFCFIYVIDINLISSIFYLIILITFMLWYSSSVLEKRVSIWTKLCKLKTHLKTIGLYIILMFCIRYFLFHDIFSNLLCNQFSYEQCFKYLFNVEPIWAISASILFLFETLSGKNYFTNYIKIFSGKRLFFVYFFITLGFLFKIFIFSIDLIYYIPMVVIYFLSICIPYFTVITDVHATSPELPEGATSPELPEGATSSELPESATSPSRDNIVITTTSERAKIPGIEKLIQEHQASGRRYREQIMARLDVEKAKGLTLEDLNTASLYRQAGYPDFLATAIEDRLTLCRQKCYEELSEEYIELNEEVVHRVQNLKPERTAPYYGFTGRRFEKDGLDVMSQVNWGLFHTTTDSVVVNDPEGKIDSGYDPNAPEGTYQPYGTNLANKLEDKFIYPNGLHGWHQFPDIDKKSTTFLTGFINHHNPEIWHVDSRESITDPVLLEKLRKA